MTTAGKSVVVEQFNVGDLVVMLNPFFKDGTRLRYLPEKDSAFNGQHILNDAELDGEAFFARVRCEEDGIVEGWVRTTNLTHVRRKTGLTGPNLKPTASFKSFKTVQKGSAISSLEAGDVAAEGDNQTDANGEGLKRLMTVKRGRPSPSGSPTRADDELVKKSAAIRRQLHRKRRGTLDPQSKLVQRWDVLTTMALLFTATVTPFEVCILEPVRLQEMVSDPLSWVNRAIDTIFALDVFVQCMLAYQEAPEKGGSWVHDRRKIIYRYATSWMPLDVLTTVPIDVIIAAYEATQAVDGSSGSSSSSDSDPASAARALRIVRMMRLLKLVRILRASRIVARWQSHFGISFALITLWWFVVLTGVTAHWMACLWILVGRIESFPAGTSIDSSDHAVTTSWIHKAGLSDATAVDIYGVSIYCSFSIIFGCGPGPAIPTSILEYYMQTVIMAIGSFMWAYVISSGCGIIATLNPHKVHFRNMMDELNFFARDKKLPRDVTVKLREFLSQTAHLHRQSRYHVLLDSFSARLKADAALVWAKTTLLKVPYFTGDRVEDEFLASCALTLKSKVYCRTEYMPLESLLVIERGIAAKDGRISTRGVCLGVDMVLNANTFRDLTPAIALTFVVQVSRLERKDLEALLTDYPLARREVRRGSFKIAFCRAIIQVAKEVVRKRTLGIDTSILEAFVTIRKAKERAAMQEARLKEPTRKLLASNLFDLSERTEAIAKDSERSRESLSAQIRTVQARMDKRVASLDSKLDSVMQHLRVPHHRHIADNMTTPAPNATVNGYARSGSAHQVESADAAARNETDAERVELREEGSANSQPLKAKAPSLRQKKKGTANRSAARVVTTAVAATMSHHAGLRTAANGQAGGRGGDSTDDDRRPRPDAVAVENVLSC